MAYLTTDDRTETIRRLTEHRITKIRRLFSTGQHRQSFASCRILHRGLPPETAYAQFGRCEGEPL